MVLLDILFLLTQLFIANFSPEQLFYIMSKDCYFFLDISVPERERKMLAICVDCQKEFGPENGWFYSGSESGYGPWNIKCCKCGCLIHEIGEECKTE